MAAPPTRADRAPGSGAGGAHGGGLPRAWGLGFRVPVGYPDRDGFRTGSEPMGVTIPPLVMAFVSAFFAAQYLSVYLRTRRSRELLTFAYATFSVSIYDAVSAAMYSAGSSEAGMRLEVAQTGALAVVSVAMLVFLADHTGYPARRFIVGMFVGYGLVLAAALVGGARVLVAAYLVGLGSFAYVGFAAAHLVRQHARDRAIRLVGATGIVFVAAVNDVLVAFHLVNSVYTVEYAFMAIVVLMADSLSAELVKAAKIEGALRDSEAKYRTLFEAATDAILLMKDGRFADCNSRALEMFACQRHEIVDHLPTDFSPAFQMDGTWSVPAAKARIASALAGEPQRFEWLHMRKDGTLFDAEVTLTRLVLGGEALLHATVRDITERKRIEDESFRSHQMLQLVLDTIPQRVFWKDRNFKFLGCNRAFAADAGVASPEEIVGKDDFKLTWHASAPLYRADDARVMSEDIVKIGFEEPQERSDGSKSWLRTSKVPLHDATGKVVGVLGTYEDITDQVEAEEALREKTEELDRFFSLALDLLCIARTDGYFLRVNAAWEQTLGYTLAELEGTRFTDLVHPDDLPATLAAMEALSSGQQLLNFASRYRCRDGSYRWIEWRSMPYEGRLIYAAARDITERKAGEEALRASEQRFRSLVEATSDWVWEIGPDGRYSYASPKVRDVLGFEPAEVIGRSPFDFMPPDEAERVRERVAEPMAEMRPFSGVENVNIRKDGRRVVLETSGVPVFDESDRFCGFRGIDRDVTERRRAEEALRASEVMYRQLIEQAADAIFITDPGGRFVLTNSATRRMLGYTEEEMRRLNVLDVYLPEEREAGRERLAQLHAGRSQTFARRMLRKDGTVIETEASAARLRDGRTQAIVRDVTERKRLEEQLLLSQKMDAIGNLAGGVAHDFNNLLQAMLTDALLLREHADDVGRVRDAARHLEEEIMRGGALTRQLLVFSRRETTRPERLDLNAVVRAATGLLRRLLKENIELRVDLSPGSVMVVADHGQLDQVLMNLAVNAADAMPDGGRLTLRTGTSADHAWLEAADTGCGIPKEIVGRIFEPFFTTKTAGKGTGLGLAVVHGIVTRHGGSVAVDTNPGAGATFTVRLPLAAPDEAPAPARVVRQADATPRGCGERVLVVEDEEGVRTGLVEILRSLGYRVAAADSAAAAARLASGKGFDVVLCDLLLPDGSGTEVVSGLVERWPGLKVIFMSGYAQEEAVRLSVTSGKVRFLQKPFDINTLARGLSESLAEPR